MKESWESFRFPSSTPFASPDSGSGRKGGTVSTAAAPSITAFFPAYNDAATIPGLVAYTDEVLSRVTGDYEIIVVNDASADHTGEVLETIRPQYPHLKIVTHVRNRGYGGGLFEQKGRAQERAC